MFKSVQQFQKVPQVARNECGLNSIISSSSKWRHITSNDKCGVCLSSRTKVYCEKLCYNKKQICCQDRKVGFDKAKLGMFISFHSATVGVLPRADMQSSIHYNTMKEWELHIK